MPTRRVPARLARKLVDSAAGFSTSFDEVPMEDIARVSGIPRATLYYYFAGKDEILAFLLDALLADFTERLATEVQPAGDTRERLGAFIRIYLELLAAHPAAAQLLFVNLGKVGKLPDIATAGDHAFLVPIRRLLEDGIRRGEIADVEVDISSGALFGAMTNVGLRELVIDESVDPARLAESLVTLLWNGVGKTPSTRCITRS